MRVRRLERNDICGDGEVELYESMAGKTWIVLVSFGGAVDSIDIYLERKNARTRYAAIAEGGPT